MAEIVDDKKVNELLGSKESKPSTTSKIEGATRTVDAICGTVEKIFNIIERIVSKVIEAKSKKPIEKEVKTEGKTKEWKVKIV